jgi:hypothetical protein
MCGRIPGLALQQGPLKAMGQHVIGSAMQPLSFEEAVQSKHFLHLDGVATLCAGSVGVPE